MQLMLRSGRWNAALVFAASLFLGAAVAAAQSLPSHVASGPLLPLILQMPENGWLRVNSNFFQDIWTPVDLRPLKAGDPSPPERIILAWSGFGWDSNRGDILLYGGGHANYSGNDVYRWRSTTLRWERASLPSEVFEDPVAGFRAIDGVNAAPSSAHTYDNNLFLPVADRFLTWGGAAHANGGPFYRVSETNPTQVRQVGPYLFDPAKADGTKVGGTTGSHVQRVAPHPEILGGRMWENRDIRLNLPGQAMPATHESGCTGSATEGGLDVVYVMGGGSDLGLYRYQLTSILAPALDQIRQVGIYWAGRSGQTTCAYDPSKRLFVRTGDNASPFTFWDLNTAGPTNADKLVTVNASISAFVSWLATRSINIRNCGLEFDPGADSFKIWCGDGVIWELKSPIGNNGVSGWSITRRDPATSSIPPGETTGTGVLGKWRYAADYDVFVGLEGIQNGNVWIYKPLGWLVPNPNGNALPTVALTSPSSGAGFSPGAPISLMAGTTDPDGAVARVEFYVNGVKVGQAVSAPFSMTWSTGYVGNYTLAAVAVDNVGGMSVSPPVSVAVTAPISTVALRRGLSGYAANFDTMLNRYAANSAQGTAATMYLNLTDYVPLLRFAIFASEGGSVPDAAFVQSATLQMYKQYYNVDVGLFPLLAGWSESQATWNQRQAGVPWAAPGAAGSGVDYRATSDAVVSGDYSPGWMNFDVTGRVQQWAAAAGTNFGWRIAQTDTSGGEKIFYSSEYLTDPTLRPQLTVVYAVGGNAIPTVSMTGPAAGSSLMLGGSFNLTAAAADSDGTVAKVEFFANGAKVGQALSVPYALTWTPGAVGNFALTAVATDNAGGTATSSAVNVSVTPGSGGTLTATLQRGLSGYAASSDTMLNRYDPNGAQGTVATLYLNKTDYVPLLRFAIFASEGGPVPDAALVQSATLQMYKQYYNADVGLYPLLVAWSESQATWNQRQAGVPWAAPGAAGSGVDYRASSDVVVSGGYNPGWMSFDVTGRVQQWATAVGTNFGWRIAQTDTSGGDKAFYSSEYLTDPTRRPKLTVVYAAGGNAIPTVSMTGPAAGSSVALGGSFNLTATAADSDGTVAKVGFFANGAQVGQALSAPYASTWTPGAVGSFALTAVATDNAGGTATSSARNVSVTAPNALPTVSMTGPAAGSSVAMGGSFNLTAVAADSDGTVAKVEFFANGAKVGQALSAPYALTWTPGASGGFALTAVATDNAGATATWSTVNVSVTPGSGGTLTATLQRGLGAYAGVADTYLSSYHQTLSWGGNAALGFSAANYVPLIRFAIFAAEGGPVPAGAIIQSARLELYKQYYDYTFRLNALLKPWGEVQATWIQSQAGVAWSNPGAAGVGTDYSATVDATGSGGFNPGWVAFDVTGRVQQWAGAVSTNFGWRIGPVGGDNNDKVFYSSEYLTDPTLRPKLTVVYK